MSSLTCGNVEVVKLSQNIGGAGGVNIGNRLAVEKGADYVWVMDDDTIPQNDASEKLIDIIKKKDNIGFLASRVLWIDGTEHIMNKPCYLSKEDKYNSLREDELFTGQYTRHINDVASINKCIYNYRFSYGGLTYRFHPGNEVLLARCLQYCTDGILHKRMLSYKKSKVFHYMFTATLNLHTKESLEVFNFLYTLYHQYQHILNDCDNPILDKRTRRRYHRIFTHFKALSRLWFLIKRKKMKKGYHGV